MIEDLDETINDSIEEVLDKSIDKELYQEINEGDEYEEKRKIPIRKCIACGEGRPKKELIRIVKTAEDGVKVDLTGRLTAEGPICPRIECYESIIKTKKLSRHLDTEVTNELYEELKKVVEGFEQEGNTLK